MDDIDWTAPTLPRPKFSSREQAACDWLYGKRVKCWVVDLVSKTVKSASGDYGNIIKFAQHHGWEG